MRKAILAFVMVAIVAAAAQPASAIDEGFQGRYRIIAHHVSGYCRNESYRRLVDVRYVNERVRQFGHPHSDSARRFRYESTRRGRGFPWRHTRGNEYKLRYDMFTGRAVGFRHAPQGCTWRVHLIPIG